MVNTVPPASPTPPPLTRGEVAVRILDADPRLQRLDRAEHLQGEIVEARRDGTVRIQTERGDITVRLPDRTPPPAEGQRVTVNVSPGSPPQQASLAPARVTPPPTQSRPQAAPSSSEAPRELPPVVVNTNTSADLKSRPVPTANLQQALAARAAGPLPPAIPVPGQIVQLQTLTAAEARGFIQQAQAFVQQSLLAPAPLPTGPQPAVPLPSLGTLSLANLGDLADGPLKAWLTTLPLASEEFLPTTEPAPSSFLSAIRAGQSSPSTVPVANLLTITSSILSQSLVADTALNFSATPGTVFQARVLTIDVPFSAPAATTSGPAAPTIVDPSAHPPLEFIALGATPQRHLLLYAPPAPETASSPFFLLQAPADGLPTGTRLALIPLALPVTTTADPAHPAAARWQPILWPLLSDLDELSRALPPDLAASLFGTAARPPVPAAQASQQLGATVFFFLAAVRGGDVQGWLGERAVDALRKMGKGGLIDRLGNTFNGLRQAITDSGSSGDWKSFLLPLQFHNDIQPFLLHTRSDRDPENDPEGGGPQTRFVIDIGFDRLGPVQVDALYRPGHLDTILRTESALGPAMRAALEQRYAAAMVQTRLNGELSFQHGLSSWVTVDAAKESVQVMA